MSEFGVNSCSSYSPSLIKTALSVQLPSAGRIPAYEAARPAAGRWNRGAVLMRGFFTLSFTSWGVWTRITAGDVASFCMFCCMPTVWTSDTAQRLPLAMTSHLGWCLVLNVKPLLRVRSSRVHGSIKMLRECYITLKDCRRCALKTIPSVGPIISLAFISLTISEAPFFFYAHPNKLYSLSHDCSNICQAVKLPEIKNAPVWFVRRWGWVCAHRSDSVFSFHRWWRCYWFRVRHVLSGVQMKRII